MTETPEQDVLTPEQVETVKREWLDSSADLWVNVAALCDTIEALRRELRREKLANNYLADKCDTLKALLERWAEWYRSQPVDSESPLADTIEALSDD